MHEQGLCLSSLGKAKQSYCCQLTEGCSMVTLPWRKYCNLHTGMQAPYNVVRLVCLLVIAVVLTVITVVAIRV